MVKTNINEQIKEIIKKTREIYRYIDDLKDITSYTPNIGVFWDEDDECLKLEKIKFSVQGACLTIYNNKLLYETDSSTPKILTTFESFDEFLNL